MSLENYTTVKPKPNSFHNHFVNLNNVFAKEQCQTLIDYASSLGTELYKYEKKNKAAESKGKSVYVDINRRKLPLNDDTKVLYGSLMKTLAAANQKTFKFNLVGFIEPLVYIEYGAGQFFNWHQDIDSLGKSNTRKLSFTIMLSGPNEFDGGDLIIDPATNTSIVREQGSMVIYPTYYFHKVTKVTRGRRKVLVGWVHGPPFV